MHVFRRPGATGTVSDDKAVLPACVATIGVFDGLHLGHQRILQRVIDEARRRHLPALAFSFEPTPQEVLSKNPPARLMRFREKAAALAALGIDELFCPPFEPAFARLPPDEFIERLLVRTLGVRHLVVGDDFRFGHARSGTIQHLVDGGQRFGYTVEQVGSVVHAGVRVSSTAVRAALAAGDLRSARRWLGRWYRICGRVVGGQKLGRQLGYPTANVNVHRRLCPLAGIFAVRIAGAASGRLDGVASIGTRPTVSGSVPLLEVHIFDFDQDIYGRRIEVEFVARLRDEVHFPDLEALKRQMDLDATEARHLLAALADDDQDHDADRNDP